jgi:hypothetical protein
MVLKSSKASIWLRNIQLSVIGIVISERECVSKRERVEQLVRHAVCISVSVRIIERVIVSERIVELVSEPEREC